MKNFISCDWGTTAFRLRLIDASDCSIITEESSKQGIAETFQHWKATNLPEDKRAAFYQEIMQQHIKAIEQKHQLSLDDVPVILSGMASSTIGMIDLPYKNIPFAVDGSDVNVHTIQATDTFKHLVVIISGVRTHDDVMRGEETKLVGSVDEADSIKQLFIFPGTHPKHVTVENEKATNFKTYMTGELFSLLSKNSILANSVQENGDFETNQESFQQGVSDGATINLLHACFLVRTNDVFSKLSKTENYFYLSGLLIGSELKELSPEVHDCITVVGNEILTPPYIKALKILGMSKTSKLSARDADDALIAGQMKIYQRHFS
jgi:2-dehydro-3-deoxygalactonokinase